MSLLGYFKNVKLLNLKLLKYLQGLRKSAFSLLFKISYLSYQPLLSILKGIWLMGVNCDTLTKVESRIFVEIVICM